MYEHHLTVKHEKKEDINALKVLSPVVGNPPDL